MTDYAFDIPDSEYADRVPNLRLAAEQPWMGLTAYIRNEPHLIVGREGDSYIMEDEGGQRLSVDFIFPFDEIKVASNGLVAASRNAQSPFKDAGLLAFDEESGEWAVRVGVSNMRFPLEERVAALEENQWKVAGPPVTNFDERDVVVPVHGKCPNCGSDSLTYAEDDDESPITEGFSNDSGGVVASADDPIVLCHACHEWCRESELDTGTGEGDEKGTDNKHTEHDTDFKDKESKTAAGAPFSFQGKPFISTQTREGIAIMPEKQSQEEMAQMIGELIQPSEQITEHINQQNELHGTSFPHSDNPFVNRGGSVTAAPIDQRYPQQFLGGPFIVVAKWLTPLHTQMFHDETPGGRGTDKRLSGFVTQMGGIGSHAFVVAQPLGVPLVIVQDGSDIDHISPGDHLRINGATGVVEVNGGDPNFVAQDPNSITVDNPIARFAYAGGHGHVEQMTPGQMTGELGGHQGMMASLMETGHASVHPETFEHNISFGYFCDNGVILQDNHPIPDQDQFIQWAHAQEHAMGLPPGPVKKIEVSAYVPEQKQAAADEDKKRGDRPDDPIKCPECGSHTAEALHVNEEKGHAEFTCLNCGNAWKQDYRKTAGAEHAKGTRIQITHPTKKGLKGSISEHKGTDKNFGDHLYNVLLDNGDELEEVPESHFTRIKSASFDTTGSALSDLQYELDATEDPLEARDIALKISDLTGEFWRDIVSEWYENRKVRSDWKNERARSMGSMQKGAPYPENSYKNAPDHSPEGQKKWPKEVNAIYNACMREGNGDKEKCAKIAWSTYKKNDGKPKHSDEKQSAWKESFDFSNLGPNEIMSALHGLGYIVDQAGNLLDKAGHVVGNIKDYLTSPNDSQLNPKNPSGVVYDPNVPKDPVLGRAHPLPEDVMTGVPGGSYGTYEGHPVMCYMCGNTRTAALGTACETCGYPLMVRRDGPGPQKTWVKSAALEPGSWYTMTSPNYKVPDVIHVKEVTESGVTGSLEGDDKGLFPVHLEHDEIEQEGYEFEPYSPSVDSGTGAYFIETQKTSRREFSAQEQKELVNENLDGRARNFHKLDLEGTHYPSDVEASTDILNETIYWW